MTGRLSLGQTVVTSTASPNANAAGDAAKKLEFLKSRMGSQAAAQPAAPAPAPSPSPASIKKRFAESRSLRLRPMEAPTSETSSPKKPETEKAIADTRTSAPAKPAPSPSPAQARASSPTPKKSGLAEAAAHTSPATPSPTPRVAKASSSETGSKVAHVAAAATPAVSGPATSPAPAHAQAQALSPAPKKGALAEHSAMAKAQAQASSPAPKKGNLAERAAAAKATPSPTPQVAKSSTPEGAPKVSRASTTPAASPTPSSTTARTADAGSKKGPTAEHTIAESATPTPKNSKTSKPDSKGKIAQASPSPTPAPIAAGPPGAGKHGGTAHRLETPANTVALAESHSAARTPPSPAVKASTRTTVPSDRYPWKMGIVTTVFWIGEPVGGHNFTPNYSSAWDSNWTRAYGGYDNPHGEARRNYIPVNFTPRQNPFYVALPYNDVTRGTTKPEARVVIPWFREAFRKEGQSVCRDRWVQIRSRSGRVVYAQWSDCGPFRTDHWQYVFGVERPRPNLNQGAGLDVSPAVRDYLGLQSTDVTDWKFVDAREVPAGPWTLYGDNNPFRGTRLVKSGSKPETVAEMATTRIRSY